MYPNAGAPRVLGGAVSRQQASFSIYRDIAATDIVPLLQFLFPLFLESGKKANNVEQYDYDRAFGTYHTSPQMAGSLSRLYDSDCALGIVDRETFQFELQSPIFPYTNSFTHHQQPNK